MTHEQIVEGNLIIAKFMGYENCKRCEDLDCYKIGPISYKPDAMKFHLDFSWLMAVIEKIIQIKYDDGDYIHMRTFSINSETGEFMVRFNRYCLFQNESLINCAYLAVVDVIDSLNNH